MNPDDRVQGWAKPQDGGDGNWHYFYCNKVSLCGVWSIKEFAYLLEPPTKRSWRVCGTCKRHRERLDNPMLGANY